MLNQIHRSNRRRTFFWFFVLLSCAGANIVFVRSQYEGIGHADSIWEFTMNFCFATFAILVLLFLWWWWTTTEFPALAWLRMSMEKNAAVFALVFCLLAWGISLLCFLRNHIISNENGQVTYSLYCIMMLPSVFTGLMYLLPPVHMEAVILPSSGFLYGALRILLVAAAFAFSAWCFLDNFIF